MTDTAYPSLGLDAHIERLQFDERAARLGLPTIANESVHQIVCHHVLQYLDGRERIAAWNEWYRVLEPAGRVHVIVPYYSHAQAFAHPLTQWPPMSEWSFWFLNKQWRDEVPSRYVEGLECDFVIDDRSTDMDGDLMTGNPIRSDGFADNAVKWYWNTVVQLTVWLTKR